MAGEVLWLVGELEPRRHFLSPRICVKRMACALPLLDEHRQLEPRTRGVVGARGCGRRSGLGGRSTGRRSKFKVGRMLTCSKQTLAICRLYRLHSPSSLLLSLPRARASRSTLCDTLSAVCFSPMFAYRFKVSSDE
jgi:hypothetical protein